MSHLLDNLEWRLLALIKEIEACLTSNSTQLIGNFTLPYFKKLAQALANNSVDDTLLRGFKDIHTYTAIHFEEAPYLQTIETLKKLLSEAYPEFNKLPLLGVEFNSLNLEL